MKTIYLTLLGLIVCSSTFGQDLVKKTPSVDDGSLKPCGQYDVLEKMRFDDPTRYQSYMQIRDITSKETSTAKSGTIYTIPVVFHVLYNNAASNISDAQIQDALNILNRDFRKLNADVNNVHSSFSSITGDVEIEFVLATVAPNGACFNGITRTSSSLSTAPADAPNNPAGLQQVNAVISGNDVYQGVWPHNKYLNIYVCRNLGGSAGYTFNPNNEGYGAPGATVSARNMYYNGVFMLHNYTGSIGTSSPVYSRALTHEVGHWLNLEHTWGSTNNPGVACGNDGVSDTPVTRGFTSCPSPSSAQICTSGVVENYENYMDYSYCSKMFTQGQVNRMRTAVTSGMGGRSNIWTNSNLQSVGVLQGTALCSADFQATQTAICTGNSTTFSVTNTSATITSYSWTFTGGTPATSTAASPTVTYNTPGTRQVSVVITTASGTRTITKEAYINVAGGNPATLPIVEGFTSSTFPPANWSITNPGGPNVWVRNTSRGTAPTAGNSAMIDFYTNETPGEVDDLNTPTFNLSNFTSASLAFDVAYQPYSSNFFDKLEVLVSPGCGTAYEEVYSKAGVALQTQVATQSSYTNPTTWRRETIDLTPYVGSSQVSVKFRGISGYGNFLYLDNINISALGSLGLEDDKNATFSIFPNPTNGEVTVSSSSPIDEITVLDNTGRIVQTIQGNKSTEIKLELNHLSSGSYHLRTRMNSTFKMDKLIIQ